MNKNYRIITDSGSDIPPELIKIHEIDIMPFSILIDDEEYLEGVNLTPHQFYDLANRSPSIPKTSQITIERFEKKILECVDSGIKDVILVTINSAGSQTYFNALKAKENLMAKNKLTGLNIHILDSHCYSIGYGYPIVEAAKKLENNKSVKSTVDYLVDWFNSVEIYIIGFDLRHMKKSGRISAAASFMGELMGLRPIIEMIDDKTKVVRKVRGDRNAIEAAIEHIAQTAVPETPWLIVRTTVTDYENSFIKGYTKKTGRPLSFESYSGAAVSSNAGTKFFGVVVKGKSRR